MATPKKTPAKKTAENAPAKKATATPAAEPKVEAKPEVEAEAEAPEPAAIVDEVSVGVENDGDVEDDDGLSPEDERDLARLTAALASLDDEGLRVALNGMREKSRQDLATQLNLPRATMHLGDALVPLVRRKLRGLSLDRQLPVATLLTERTNDATVHALGDRHDDPTRADLDDVLPAVVEEHGIGLVRVMLAGYAVSDAPVRPVTREILDTDEQFAMPELTDDDGAPTETELPSFGLVAQVPRAKGGEDPERAALREQRKAAKAERRAAAVHAREAKATAEASRRDALHASKRPSRGR